MNTAAAADTLSPTDHRRRLLDAMAHAVASKGYAAVTIADLAAEARVSKRSFYEHFADKAACLVALYEAASRQSLDVLRQAIDPQRDWHQQLEQALTAYFGTLACNPPLLRTLFVDIIALGPTGLAARRANAQRLADFIVQVAGPELPPELAVALVGGIHEWVLQAVEQERVAQLPELVGPAAQLVRAVVDHPH
ncbi:TetR/AcrR family transcriptional regulator [Aquabacterium sp.]|uniref:TetR/AcrR family transcriptional regulator n=1 Tax=Aquabacterium sp. TaxID=1872578 RepID=UPI002BE6DC67|nr:TetR/AcrR family transcriptional regulator [Aquabacterium sp.]HSW05560.1 TetR/AcrR family transcriptional regulator [Aquabacterium sp.]